MEQHELVVYEKECTTDKWKKRDDFVNWINRWSTSFDSKLDSVDLDIWAAVSKFGCWNAAKQSPSENWRISRETSRR